MIVFCEECGQKNILDPENIVNKPRCQFCNDILRINVKASPTMELGAGPAFNFKLELKFRENVLEINKTRPSITMGRQRYNDLVVEDNRVSRSHARFEYRKDKFVLIDQSTNGTYVFIKGKKGMNLRQDELPLDGNGFIGLGRKVASNSPEAIHFSVKT